MPVRAQVVTARTKVENGLVFELTLKLGQGQLPNQIHRVRARWLPLCPVQGRRCDTPWARV